MPPQQAEESTPGVSISKGPREPASARLSRSPLIDRYGPGWMVKEWGGKTVM